MQSLMFPRGCSPPDPSTPAYDGAVRRAAGRVLARTMLESTDTSWSNSSITCAMTRTFAMSVVTVPLREQRQNPLWDDQAIRYKRRYRGGSSQWTDGSL